MTEEDKLRLKILQIKTYRFLVKTMKKSKKIARKVGLSLGFLLIALSAKSQTSKGSESFSDLIAKVSTVYKNNPKDLLAALENSANDDASVKKNINKAIDTQIDILVDQLMNARTDSLLSSIDKLNSSPTPEIKRNFRSSIGRNPKKSELRLYCLATQCAADYRALKAMGLDDIIPRNLRIVSAGTGAFAKHLGISPFVHKVKTDSATIANYIQEHGLGVGTYIFYPRAGGSYHAMSVSEIKDFGDTIKLSGANKQRKNVDISSKGWITSRETLIIDMAGVYTSFIKNYIEGKTLDEQVTFLYHGGAEEFIKQLKRESGIKEDDTLLTMLDAGVKKMAAEKPLNEQTANAAFLLALVPLAYKRKSGETMRNLATIENKLAQIDDLNEAYAYLDKNFDKALTNLSSAEKEQFFNGVMFGGRQNGEIDATSGYLLAYIFGKKALANINQPKENNESQWHKVAKEKKKTLPAQKKSVKNGHSI